MPRQAGQWRHAGAQSGCSATGAPAGAKTRVGSMSSVPEALGRGRRHRRKAGTGAGAGMGMRVGVGMGMGVNVGVSMGVASRRRQDGASFAAPHLGGGN